MHTHTYFLPACPFLPLTRQLLKSILSIFLREPLAEWQKEARLIQKHQQLIAVALQKQRLKDGVAGGKMGGGCDGDALGASFASPEPEEDPYVTEASHIRLKVGVDEDMQFQCVWMCG